MEESERSIVSEEIQWIDGPGPLQEFSGESIPLLLNDIEDDDDQVVCPQLNEVDTPIPPWDASLLTTIDIVKKEVSHGPLEIAARTPGKWTFIPMLNRWKELLHIRTVKHNQELIRKYHRCLEAFFGKDHVPVEITATLEASPLGVAKTDDTQLGDDRTDVDYPHLVSLLCKSSLLESQVTKQLRMLFLASLNLLNDIVDVTTKILRQMHLVGCLLVGTPEHVLCQTTCIKMMDLMKKLQVLSVILRTKIPRHSSPQHDVILAGTKIRCDSWISDSQGIHQVLSTDVLFSVAPQIECLFVTAYESILRITCPLGYFLAVPELTEAQHFSLMITAGDLTISLRDIQKSVRSSIINYETTLEIALKELEAVNVSSEPTLPSFSRESKLKRHCDEIVKWSANFSEHAMTLQLNAMQLESINEEECGTQRHHHLISELKRQEAASYEYLKHLTHLLKVQSVLSDDVAIKQDSLCKVPSDVSAEFVKNDNSAVNTCNQAGGNTEENLIQPVEFDNLQNFDTETADGLVTDSNQVEDEVFIGMPNDTNAESTFTSELDGSSADKKLATVIYGGVVDQLRTVLQPVQSQMKVREKEAVVKKYGDVPNACVEDSDHEDKEDDNKENTSSSKMTKGKHHYYRDDDSDTKKDEESSDEETNFVAGASSSKYRNQSNNDSTLHEDCTFESDIALFPHGDFMKELRQKLNTGPNPLFHVRKNEEDDELVDEPDSESDSNSDLTESN